MSEQSKISIYQFTSTEWRSWFQERRHPAYRTRQLLQWIYQRGVKSVEEMSDLSKTLRGELEESFFFEVLPVVDRQEDSADGTVKYLFELSDGERIEAALMPRFDEEARTDPQTGKVVRNKEDIQGYTVCLSTQAGCAFACRFCASGKAGLKRNLSTGEIISQVMTFHHQEKPVSRVVFMGTGEPLHNLEEVRRAIDILTDKEGLAYSPRRITVSTVGLVPEIYRIAKEGWKVKLAISLHATTDEKRAEIMPLARAYQLDQLRDAVLFYQRNHGRRISLEYLMIHGVNDSRKDAERLLRFCEGLPCHVNLIPYNSIAKSGFRSSSPDSVQNFKNCLRSGNIDVTVRYSRGRNIDAACGQLRLHHENEPA